MSPLTVVLASRKLVQTWTENPSFQLFSDPKRDRDQNVVHSLRDRDNLEKKKTWTES